MKRKLVSLLSLILVFTLSGCDESKAVRLKCKDISTGAIIFVDKDTTGHPIKVGERVYVTYDEYSKPYISDVPSQRVATVDSIFEKK